MNTMLRTCWRKYHDPWWQNIATGVIVGLTAGIYVALNLLGAGGGRPDRARVVQISNSALCAVWFFSSCFAGTVLNLVGPALTLFVRW